MPLNTAIWLRASTPGEVVARSQINRFQANATLTELDSGALAEHGDAGEAEQGDHANTATPPTVAPVLRERPS